MGNEQPQAAPSQERPVLAVALDQLAEITTALVTAASQYREVRELRATPSPEVQMQLRLPSGALVSVPTGDPEVTAAWLEDALNRFGEQIVQLWQQALQVCTTAVQHCQAAAPVTPPTQPG